MKIKQAVFRPVTIYFETKDELDMLMAIIRYVADNRIYYPAQHVQVAKGMLAGLNNLEIDDHDELN